MFTTVQKKCDGTEKIQKGYSVGFHFTATVDESSKAGTKGQKVESSLDKGIAPSFSIGEGKVIEGLDTGMIGLCKGSKASIVIPPHLAYGESGKPPYLPGGVTLKYDVEIIDIKPPTPNDFVKIDANKDGKVSRKEAEEYFAAKGQLIDLDALWKDEDKDKDGFISWTEFSGPKGDGPPPPPQKKKPKAKSTTKQEKEVDELIAAMDTDKDRRVSKSEMRNFFTSKGEVMTDELWEGFDTNKDGFVSRTDLLVPINTQQKKKREKAKPELSSQQEKDAAAFELMDTDKDGKINKEELGAFFKSAGTVMSDEFWEESDKNKDGFVSWKEFIGSEDPPSHQQQKDEL